MIIEFWIDGEMNRVSGRHEVEVAVDRVINELEAEREVPIGFYPGTIASFHVFDIPEGAEVPEVAENSLIVGVNRTTGYGGMIWWGEEIPEDPNQFYWVTRNEDPPSVDPRVTADPGHPLWYDRRNVVPLTDIKSALVEFCFSGGKRPVSVEWEPSTANGQRLSS
ncbi:Imm1 family immunity protein [Streptomyces sp. NPDC058326]|uniref:Imm1 family immunity protein n=1 Tax=Streptomyces sp. NPDC058326 TaxID=3346447 RepID=UPI0036E25069